MPVTDSIIALDRATESIAARHASGAMPGRRAPAALSASISGTVSS